MTPPGSGGVRGSSSTTAEQIVERLFEGDKKKQTEAQRAAQQRQQAQVQQELGSTAQQRAQQEEGRERTRDSRAAREEGAPDQARVAQQGAPQKTAQEIKRDAFMRANLQQHQYRSAGGETMRGQLLPPQNAQGWSVANSAQTPEPARAFILAQQQTPQAQPTRPMMGQQPQAMPFSTSQALPQPLRGENFGGLLIRYAQGQSGGETSARAFLQRSPLPDGLTRLMQRVVREQGSQFAQQAFARGIPIAVHIRGNLVFVKDRHEFRAFRLNEDGSLTELPTDDSGEHPLSPEAQAHLHRVLRQKGLRFGTEGWAAEEAQEILQEQALEQEAAEQLLKKQMGDSEGLDFESRFALLLHAVLEEEKEVGKKLKEGELVFAGKEDWEGFFLRMLGLGNQEKNAKKMMDSILNLIFRGMFKKGDGNVLVGDFKYLTGGKTKEEKFAQIKFDNDTLLELLKKLQPGNKLSPDQLREFFGEELSYLQLAHITEKLSAMVQASEKNVVYNPKGSIDLFSQARLERSIFGEKRPPPTSQGKVDTELPPALHPPGFFANVFEFFAPKERYRGRPRLYTFIAYTVILSAIGIGVAVLLMKLM